MSAPTITDWHRDENLVNWSGKDAGLMARSDQH